MPWEVDRIVIFLYMFLLISVFTDMKKGIIPNWLIFIGMAVGILTTDSIKENIFQAVAALLLFFPFFAIGAIGAGDIKCIFVIGLYLNHGPFILSILYSFSIAALISIFIILRNFIIYKTLKNNTNQIIHLAVPIFYGVLLSTGGTYL